MEHLDRLLTRRLAEIGLDAANFGDPGEAWRRLHAHFGRRVTLVDRYALEAASRGVPPEALDAPERTRLAREVMETQNPGIEFLSSAVPQPADPVEIVGYQGSWATSFQDWRKRLREVDTGAVRIEHVGSTAVRGLPAKPVIDVQISVRDVEDEASYVPAIEDVGPSLHLREEGHRFFRPNEGRRSVHIHVCAAAGDWEREHLLFRDYLRSDPPLKATYGRLKRELAERYRIDRLAYTEAKTGFILDALDAAEAWADRTSWRLPPELGP